MTWLNVDDGMGEHPKADDAGNAALGLWLRLACYSARRLTDGLIRTPVVTRYGTPEELAALIESGLVDVVDNGYQLHDYLDWNKSREQIEGEREASRLRVQKWREKHPGKSPDPVDSNGARNGVRTRSTPLHSTPPSKEGEGSTGPPEKGGTDSPKPPRQRKPKPPKCPTHHQTMPCLGCASDEIAGP